jgi:hypothetical protein
VADINFELFDGKTFKDLCRDVIDRSDNKKIQLDTIIGDLRTLIKGPNDIPMLIPRIKELLEVGVKNDEQLIKLAAVVQRLHSTQIEATGGEDGGLSEEEKDKLLEQHLADVQKNLVAIKQETEIPIPK